MKCSVFSDETLLLVIPHAPVVKGYLFLWFCDCFVLLVASLTCFIPGDLMRTSLEILLWQNATQVLCESSRLRSVNNGLKGIERCSGKRSELRGRRPGFKSGFCH